MFSRITAFSLVSFFLFFAACASLTHNKNEAVVKNVKKIAVIGFSVVQPANAIAGGSMVPHQSEDVNQMYDALVKSFGKNMAWTVVAPSKMRQNAAYKTAYENTMKGFQNKMPPGKGQVQYNVDGIMDKDSARLLGAKGRTELMKALGVDAVVSATVDVLLSGTTVMGIGSRYPQSRLSFFLYAPNADTADWFEGNIEGEPSKTSVGKTAFFDEKLLSTLALESAKTAFARIGTTANN